MLSPQTLNRVSSSYRRGYEDGYAGRDAVGEQTDGPFDRPFASFDYTEGHKAGANDRKWSDYYSSAEFRASREGTDAAEEKAADEAECNRAAGRE